MADFSEELQKIADLLATAEGKKSVLVEYETLMGKIKNAVNNLNNEIKELSKNESENKEIINQKKKELNELNQQLERANNLMSSAKPKVASEAMKDLGSYVRKASEDFGELSGKLNTINESTLSKLGKGLLNNSAILSVFNENTAKLINPLSDFSFASSLTIGKLGGLNISMSALNDALKNSLTAQNVARTGFTLLGDSIEEANLKSMKYPTTLIHMSAMFGMSTSQLNDFNKIVADLPGVLDDVSSSIKESTEVGNGFVQSSALLMTGLQAFGKTGADAANFVRNSMLNMGLSVDQVADYIGQMSVAMKDVDISYRVAADQISKTGSILGIFGDNASRATSLWSVFATTLRQGGVAATQVGEIFNQVASGIAGMSTQNRAFISMMSGMFRGASALGGALRMELAMRTPGGLESNLEALTSSLARFGGGQIITLEQAANNPQLEMQFTLQRQMLGKLAGISNTEQQNRVLEVLQNVQRGGISRIEGAKELKNVMDRGENIQKRQVTFLEQIDQNTKSIAESISGTNINIAALDESMRGGTGAPGERNFFQRLGRVGSNLLAGKAGAEEDLTEGIKEFRRQIGSLGDDIKIFKQRINVGTFGLNNIVSAVRRGTQNELGELPTPEIPPRTEMSALISANSPDNRLEDMKQSLSVIKEGSAAPGTAKTTSRVINETESTITVKISADHEAFKEWLKGKIKDGIGEEASKISNGERE